MIIKNNLYGWIFTYNPVTSNWRACSRDRYMELFSIPEENFLRSKELSVLEELIIKYGDSEEVINSLIYS